MLAPISFLCLIPLWLWLFRTFDSLIQLEYEQFNDSWIQDGHPSGLFWHPPEIGVSKHKS